MKYHMLEIYRDKIATAACRIAVDVPRNNTWEKTDLVLDTDKDFHESWRKDISLGAEHLLKTTYISATDRNLDAKLWPHMHVYGTGSLNSEAGSGGMDRLVKNRLLCIQSCFRENNLYAFWYLHRIITHELFFNNFMARQKGSPNASDEKAVDQITRLYGTVIPSYIPESTAWWRNQQDLTNNGNVVYHDYSTC